MQIQMSDPGPSWPSCLILALDFFQCYDLENAIVEYIACKSRIVWQILNLTLVIDMDSNDNYVIRFVEKLLSKRR